jgi:histidine triad (HIT) family protein
VIGAGGVDCPFCEIAAGRAPVTLVHEWPDALALVPLNPVVDGHTLVIPRQHVEHFAADPEVSALTMRRAAELMRWTDRPMNVITSRGREATQSVAHLHLHLVPRAENDGLALPWYSGKGKGRAHD